MLNLMQSFQCSYGTTNKFDTFDSCTWLNPDCKQADPTPSGSSLWHISNPVLYGAVCPPVFSIFQIASIDCSPSQREEKSSEDLHQHGGRRKRYFPNLQSRSELREARRVTFHRSDLGVCALACMHASGVALVFVKAIIYTA